MKLFPRKNKIPLTAEQKKERNKDRLLLIASGLLMGVAFPPFPFPFPLLLFVGLIPYLFVIEKKKTLAEINRATYLSFFVFSVITLYWVGSWQKAADPFLMIAGGVLLFFNPLLFLIPSSLLHISRKYFSPRWSLYLFPFFWIFYEYLYTLTDLHFPWLTLGNGLAKFTVFVQGADLIGAVGLSLVVVYINVFLYKGIFYYKTNKKYSFAGIGAGLLIFTIFFVYGLARLSDFRMTDKKITVGLIQPNLNPWEKWTGGDPGKLVNMYLSMSKEAADSGAKLIVWPETALPFYLMDGMHKETVNSIYSFLKKNDVYLMTGMPDVRYYFKGEEAPPGARKAAGGSYYYTIYNGILLFSPNSIKVQRYGKMKLVPFGESVPFADKLPFLSNLIKWGVGISGWNVGRDTTDFRIPAYNYSSMSWNKSDSVSISGIVCFESVFPYFITNFVKRGANLITVVTNDSWYGKSSGPYQHEDISILRAVENRRSVIRAANGGISCIINPLGVVEKHTKLFTKAVLTGSAHLESGESFFTAHPFIVPWSSVFISVLIMLIGVFKKIRLKFS